MLVLGLCLALVAQGDAVQGKVKVTRGPIGKAPRVAVITDAGSVRVAGELASEIARLGSAKIELRGLREGDQISAKSYTILEVSGVKPMVGFLIQTASGFALKDGDAADIPLSLPPRSRKRLTDQAGAKLWVYGKPLVSGELKVLKYGILRPPPTSKKTE